MTEFTNNMTDILQRVACKAVIVNDEGKLLVVREASTYSEGTNIGRYGVPGGRVNPGEPFVKGLLREVYEEVGLKISVGRPLHVGEWFPEIKNVKNHIVAIYFECKVEGDGAVRLSEEHDDFRWIDFKQLKTLDIMSPDGGVLLDYLKNMAR